MMDVDEISRKYMKYETFHKNKVETNVDVSGAIRQCLSCIT